MTDSKDALTITLIDGVLRVMLDDPARGNALSISTATALASAFQAAAADLAVRTVLLEGAGRHFSTGGDVATFGQLIEGSIAERLRQFEALMAAGNAMVQALVAIPVPVVAACRGVVAGGGLALVLAADTVVADSSAQFLFSHGRVALPPDAGVSWLLPRIVGHRLASEWILGAATVTAENALAKGLVSRLVDAAKLDIVATELAGGYANGAAAAIRSAKQLLTQSATTTLAAQLTAERDAVLAAVKDPDFPEGVRSLLQNRVPVFASAT